MSDVHKLAVEASQSIYDGQTIDEVVTVFERYLAKAQRKGLLRATQILESECPNCGDAGFTVGVEAVHGCDGSEEMCSQVCPVPEQVQIQCDCLGAKTEAIRKEVKQ